MLRFIFTRLALIVPTFVGITLLAFLLIHAVPGDPIETLAGERGIPAERHEQLLHEYKIRDNERLMPGEGVIDLPAFFRALKKIGYSDGVSPEVFGRGLKNMPPEEGAKMGLETTRAVMRRAGVA